MIIPLLLDVAQLRLKGLHQVSKLGRSIEQARGKLAKLLKLLKQQLKMGRIFTWGDLKDSFQTFMVG